MTWRFQRFCGGDWFNSGVYRPFILFVVAAALRAAAPCPMPQNVSSGATLVDFANRFLGNSNYAISIALATNARTADGFSYISNPDDIKNATRVCIPGKSEARELRKNWSTYERAVDTARLPRISAIDPALVTIPPDQPVNVVSWMRKDQVGRLKTAPGDWVKTAPAETWVTVEPNLRQFCQAFAHDHHPDEAKLTQRLEQRLGLSPSSSKTDFVRMRLDHPGPDTIFRPCVDSAVDHASCSVGPPPATPQDLQQWFNQQYYSSYGQSLISESPWTGLGYTFDWANAPGKQPPFQRFGESEFVIRKDAPIEILEVLTTAQYCYAGAR